MKEGDSWATPAVIRKIAVVGEPTADSLSRAHTVIRENDVTNTFPVNAIQKKTNLHLHVQGACAVCLPSVTS